MPQLVGKEVGPIGFGLMGLTWRGDKNPSQAQSFEALRAALKNGLNFWNAGEIYGTPEYNSLHLLEAYFAKYPEDADKVVLSIKGGYNHETGHPDSSPENVRRSIDNSIALLKGRKKIDIFECARNDPKVPLEVTLEFMDKEFVQTGKIGGIGISEAAPATFKKAVKITKIAAIEIELSLWATDALTNGIVETAKEHNVPVVAYSPLGRGILTGQIKSYEDVPENLRIYPRYQKDTFPINLELVKHVEAIASKKGVKTSQLAINWVRAQSKKAGVTIIPIPGATTESRIEENSKVVDLTDEELADLDAVLQKIEIVGKRYPDFIPSDT